MRINSERIENIGFLNEALEVADILLFKNQWSLIALLTIFVSIENVIQQGIQLFVICLS